MNVFERLHSGEAIDIRDKDYQREFVQGLFMGSFTRLGKIFDLNRNTDMRLIDMVFKRVAKKDQKDIKKYPAGFINVTEPYDKEHHAARYHFTQCPNAEFAKSQNCSMCFRFCATVIFMVSVRYMES